MTEIPANCILNKGITGCGTTTLAIRQAGHTIIAMPFVGLIQNKEYQHSEVLGIYGSGDKTGKIKEYMQKHATLKIAVTYDSLPKLCNILTDLGFNPYKGSHLVIDEWHILFNAYIYRNEAIKGLLDIAGQFDKVTYISATPVERKY